MPTGFDLDLTRQVNQVSNRIRGLYTQFHPALEAVLGPRLKYDAILEVIATWPTAAQLAKAGPARIAAKLKKYGARRYHVWSQEICQALTKQTVTVSGTDANAAVLPLLARQLLELHRQRDASAAQVEDLVDARPLCQGLTSMPNVKEEDRRNHHRQNLRQTLRQRCRLGFLRWIDAQHAPIRNFHPLRNSQPRRQQTPQTSLVPLRLLRHLYRQRIRPVLPTQTRPRKTPQPSNHRPSPPPPHRH